MNDDTTIVQFPRAADPAVLPECAVEVEPRLGRFCEHGKIRLVEHDRNIQCALCGATIDPFAYLLSGAHAVRRAWQDHMSVMHRVKDIERRIEDLEKERRRLAAAVKRLKVKADGDVLDVRRPL